MPLIAGIFGVSLGIATLVGEEDDGTLELMAALPISRVQLILAKVVALLIAAFIALVMAGLAAMGVFTMLQIDAPVTAPDLFWVILSHWLMAFVFLTLSLFLGAYLPNRGTAMSASAATLLVSFLAKDWRAWPLYWSPTGHTFPFRISNISWEC